MMKNDNNKNGNFPNLPLLRFSEFAGEWKVKKLGEVSKFSKGKGISKNDIVDDGINECIRYGELYTIYNELINVIYSKTNVEKSKSVLSEINDVIIPSSGETQLDIARASCVLKKGVILGGDLNIIKSKKNGIFLSYYLNSKKKISIARLSQGNSVVHLYSKQLASLDIFFPSFPEQTKIANFLTKLDEKIQVQREIITQLETLIKGYRQKLFSQELRFKDENGKDFSDWEEKKLGEVMSIPTKIKAINIDSNKLLTVKLHLKGVSINDNTKTLSLGATNYFIRKKGQFIYGKQNLFNGAFDIIPNELDGFLSSGDVPTLDIDEIKVNKYYLLHYFSQKSVYKKLENIASGSGSKRIHESVFLKLKINFPSLKEQTKIANFLSKLDEKLTTEKELLTELEEQKKFFLQNMFV